MESPRRPLAGHSRQVENPRQPLAGRFRQMESPRRPLTGHFRQVESPRRPLAGRFRQVESPRRPLAECLRRVGRSFRVPRDGRCFEVLRRPTPSCYNNRPGNWAIILLYSSSYLSNRCYLVEPKTTSWHRSNAPPPLTPTGRVPRSLCRSARTSGAGGLWCRAILSPLPFN